MPPKARITREMILEAAFEIARESGIESVNARTISSRLQCSTQPVLYYFQTMDELRREVYRRADAYHTAYITGEPGERGMQEIGRAYVRFAATEKYLFRLLFQSDQFAQQSMEDLVSNEDILPILETLAAECDMSLQQARDAFMSRFMLVHGMASLLANNSMRYDEETVDRILANQFPDEIEEE